MPMPLQVSGVGYSGAGTVSLLPTKETLKEFANMSVGKLVEVSQEPQGPQQRELGALGGNGLVLGEPCWAFT